MTGVGKVSSLRLVDTPHQPRRVRRETAPAGLGMSIAEVYALPAAVDLETAGRALSIGRTKAFELAKAGEFPIPVLRLGRKYRCTKADILRWLALDVPTPGAGTH